MMTNFSCAKIWSAVRNVFNFSVVLIYFTLFFTFSDKHQIKFYTMNACIYIVIYFIACFSYINCQCYVDTSYLNGVYDEKFESNHLICDPPPLDAMVTVNTFKNDKQLYSASNPFASACVKCLLCTTIAEHMQKMLMSLHTTYPPTSVFNNAKLNSTMRYFCNNGFKKYV